MKSSLTLDEAAEALRKSRRWLQAWLARHPADMAGVPFYIPMGRTKTFEETDIDRIRAAIREEERGRLYAKPKRRAPPAEISSSLWAEARALLGEK